VPELAMGKKADPKAAAVVEEEAPPPPPEPEREHLVGNFVFPDGSSYSGEYVKINEDVSMHGMGALITGPEVFKGAFENGAFKEGKYTACSGAVYTGAFRGNLFHGVGEYKWPDGREFKGTWRDGLMHGRGQFKNFSFGAEKCHTGFSIGGHFASNREEQEEMRRQFIDEYFEEHNRSATNALKDLASRATAEGAPTEYFVLAAQPDDSPDVVSERTAILEIVDGPFPDASACSQPSLQGFAARLEDGCENPLVASVLEEKCQCAERFDGRRLKREQLQHAGQCVVFSAPDAAVGTLGLAVFVNVSQEYDVALARWKLVYCEEASAPAG
jgi:hypothetical protein